MPILLDGQFRVKGSKCKHYCSPSCHPAQLGPDWKYWCLHPSWPQNQEEDFCPIVDCGGDPEKCEVKDMSPRYPIDIGGLTLTLTHKEIEQAFIEFEKFLSVKKEMGKILKKETT